MKTVLRTLQVLGLCCGLLTSCTGMQAVATASSTSTKGTPAVGPGRPPLVHAALATDNNETATLYYFGLGSNMLKSKVQNRSSEGPIEWLSMEPAYVRNHRLSFSLRAFPPLEPGMGSIEPCSADGNDDKDELISPLSSYHAPECHGSLMELNVTNYERLMRTEGIGTNRSARGGGGYQEIVVTAVPYDGKAPVEAIALQAVSKSRLRREPSPSRRYMNILRQGAEELGLKPCYQDFLAQYPVQNVPVILRSLSIYNLIGTFTLSAFLKGWRGLSRFQSSLLYTVYVPGNARVLFRRVSDLLTAAILMPGALLGVTIETIRKLRRKEASPFLKRMKALLDDDNTKSS